MFDTAQYYLTNGARLVWLVHPEKRLVIVITSNNTDILTEGDTLDGGEVLPGFQLSVRQIFPTM
jgi:Uma2 family endonuclease